MTAPDAPILRPARAGEAALLGDIACAAKASWGYAPAQLDAWRAELRVTEQQLVSQPTIVALMSDEFAGFVMLAPGPQAWSVDHLWVLPAWQHRGIGRALLQAATAQAALGNASSLRIESDPHAEAFYLSCGAHRVETISAPIPSAPARVIPIMRLPLWGQVRR